MSAFNKKWEDGSGDYLTVSSKYGAGNDTLQISSVPNEGTDREMTVYVTAGSLKSTITIRQSGKRDVLNAYDGSFLTADGQSFNVLK